MPGDAAYKRLAYTTSGNRASTTSSEKTVHFGQQQQTQNTSTTLQQR
jgi:hypothetical protein